MAGSQQQAFCVSLCTLSGKTILSSRPLIRPTYLLVSYLSYIVLKLRINRLAYLPAKIIIHVNNQIDLRRFQLIIK